MKAPEIIEERVRFGDDRRLSGVLAYTAAAKPLRAVLLCSPHPNFAGDMENNVIVALATRLSEDSVTLRFDYRGVGDSQISLPNGTSAFDYWDAVEQTRDYSDAALADTSEAILELKRAAGQLPLFAAGYSFGAIIVPRAVMADGRFSAIAGIAPPLTRISFDFLANCPLPCLMISGLDDFVYDPTLAARLSALAGPNLTYERLTGSDHFFLEQERMVADRVASFFAKRFHPMNDVGPIGPERIVQKKREYLMPCTQHFYRRPPQFVRGEGMYLFDVGGKAYMDLFAGVSVHALGHCHPDVVDAICRQVRALQHTTTIYLTQPMVDLAEALAGVLPGELKRTFFCASGSEANEGAALLARLHTGRQGFLAFEGSLHGRTKLAMSLTGLPFWRIDPDPVTGIVHVPHPSFSTDHSSRETCERQSLDAVENAISREGTRTPAAMFVELVQGSGGINVPSPAYFGRLKSMLERRGVLLVADEVQTGFGRTGSMFASTHWDIAPDILTGGKALGGGTPIGFFSTTDAIAASFTRPSASTFGGNPVTAAAGLAVLRVLQRDRLVERSAELGRFLKSSLTSLAAGFEPIAEVRGIGLMVGVQLREHVGQTAAELCDHILERMKDDGFLIGKTGAGRDVLTWMPPLIVSEAQLKESVNALRRILESL